ncbi:uncharacterized protein IWZ02DRAFT_308694 [Phyllosticta citriasiana]|uniref:uncharacterized protein n=1 Tax=Phyllosticta citriasiana TaxID=595635 RepID=UPI0030FD4CEA
MHEWIWYTWVPMIDRCLLPQGTSLYNASAPLLSSPDLGTATTSSTWLYPRYPSPMSIPPLLPSALSLLCILRPCRLLTVTARFSPLSLAFPFPFPVPTPQATQTKQRHPERRTGPWTSRASRCVIRSQRSGNGTAKREPVPVPAVDDAGVISCRLLVGSGSGSRRAGVVRVSRIRSVVAMRVVGGFAAVGGGLIMWWWWWW